MLHVDAADRLVQRRVGSGQGALPAGRLLGRAGQGSAIKGEALVDEGFRQAGTEMVDLVEGQEILPGGEVFRPDQGRFTGRRAWMPDREFALVAQTGRLEESVPVHA